MKKLKRKGAYEYERQYHQDVSALVVAKAVEQYLVNNIDIESFIKHHTDEFDFCIRGKVPRSNRLVIRYPELDFEHDLQKLTRYFIAHDGGELVKIAPPRGIPGQYKRKNKLTHRYFESIMAEIGQDVWDERVHTKNKSVHVDSVETKLSSGYKVKPCNDISEFDWDRLNYDYYIEQAMKLVI